MLLYVDGAPEGYPKELVQFLTYMKSSTTENACNPELEQIHSCVDKVKKDDKVQEDFMKLKAYLDMEMDAERKENANKIEKEKNGQMRLKKEPAKKKAARINSQDRLSH